MRADFWHRVNMERNRSTAAWRGERLHGVLFDLDGTLLDTAADIARALNRTFAEYGLEPMPVGDVSRMIGRGTPILIERAAAARGRVLNLADHTAMIERFFHHYGALEETNDSDAQPYPGVIGTLRTLHEAGMAIAVVTNKHHRFASGLLHRLDLSQWVDVVVGGDTCERRKPDPQPLLFACNSLGVSPSHALMVGDSIPRDMRGAETLNMEHALLKPLPAPPCCAKAWPLTSLTDLEARL